MKRSVVVIGGGLAGTLLANRLAGDADVTLLEIGEQGKLDYPEISYVRKRFAEVKTLCFGEGGTTNLWHNGLIPIRRDDVQSSFFREVLREAETYQDDAAARLHFLGGSYRADYAATVAEMNELAARMGIFADGVDCLLYPKKYSPLRIDERVRAHYRVRDISFVAEGGRIAAVEFTSSGRPGRVKVGTVVISAGTTGSPRLVEGVLGAVGGAAASVGTGLIDHPLGFLGKVKLKKEHAESMRTLSLADRGTFESCTAGRLKSSCGRYTCFAFFRPALTMANRLPIYKYKSLLGASSGAARIRNAFSPKIFHPDILAEIYCHLFGVNLRSRIFNVLIYFEQRGTGNRVSYDGDGLVVDWGISGEELTIYNEILERLRDSLAPVAEKINLQTPVTPEWLWSGAHHSGTVRVGDGPDAPLDRNLALKGCANVYVCDGSVIPEHSYANTGLTIGQLALRLADRLLGAPVAGSTGGGVS